MFSNKCKVEAIKQSRYSISHSLENFKSTLHRFWKKPHTLIEMQAIYFKQESETVMAWQKYQGEQWCFKVWGKKTQKKTLH